MDLRQPRCESKTPLWMCNPAALPSFTIRPLSTQIYQRHSPKYSSFNFHFAIHKLDMITAYPGIERSFYKSAELADRPHVPMN